MVSLCLCCFGSLCFDVVSSFLKVGQPVTFSGTRFAGTLCSVSEIAFQGLFVIFWGAPYILFVIFAGTLHSFCHFWGAP